jgi:hypothetical protein
MSEPVPPSTDARDDSERALEPWPRWTSELHESLASQEASAAELRQELDDLRRSLDAAPTAAPAPGPTPNPAEPSHRRRIVLAGAGVVVAVAVAGGVATAATRPDPGPATATGSTPSSPAGTSASTATPTGTPTGTPTTSASGAAIGATSPLPAWPGQRGPQPPGLPAHGVGADVAGTEVTAALTSDRRSVDVYERALLTTGATTLTLGAPAAGDLVRSLHAPLPGVQELHAAVDGRPVPVGRSGAGWTVAVPRGSAASRLVLRYRLSGALIRPEPAPPGRYTLLLTPLAPAAGSTAGDAAGAPVVVRVRDARVEELYCPTASNQLCGREDGPLHVATVPTGASPVVVGLVTFPS